MKIIPLESLHLFFENVCACLSLCILSKKNIYFYYCSIKIHLFPFKSLIFSQILVSKKNADTFLQRRIYKVTVAENQIAISKNKNSKKLCCNYVTIEGTLYKRDSVLNSINGKGQMSEIFLFYKFTKMSALLFTLANWINFGEQRKIQCMV